MHELIQQSLPFIYFVYGLSFFIAGYTILFQSLRLSTIGFAREIRYFGLFFLFHGLADWAPVFFHEQEKIFSEPVMDFFFALQYVFLLASFYFLFVYSVKLLTTYNYNKFLLLLPNFSLVLISIVSIYFYLNGGFSSWYLGAKFYTRHFIGLPSIMLTAYALRKDSTLIESFYNTDTKKYLKIINIALFIYGLSILISHKAPFFPANVINADTFLDIVGLPIQLIRAICGIVIAYSMVILLDAFHKDFIQKFEQVEKQTAIYEERERFSQDIHDGTMQSLFGIGLRLHHIDELLEENDTDAAKKYVNEAMQKVDETSKEIRGYITGLRRDNSQPELIHDIKNIIDEFMLETGIHVHFDYQKIHNYDLSPEIISQVYFIVKEALNNVRKHSQATLVQMIVVVYIGKLELIVRDNGKGFECDNKGDCVVKGEHCYGLNGIKKRVHNLKGLTSINSRKGEGTEISVIIPLGE